jgi:hypothetical protein
LFNTRTRWAGVDEDYKRKSKPVWGGGIRIEVTSEPL